ncbi:glycosyltransferase family 2 protein [Tranquillimonas rosea]|uniref:glycosyltransferase family 2 protein n=1 Tax=Tranquillimonas rosea TaxID=641238 RepID=UPI003BA84454
MFRPGPTRPLPVWERADRPLLGEVLRDGGLPADTIESALARQEREAARLGEILLAEGAVRAETLAQALARQFEIETCHGDMRPDRGLVRRLGPEWCLANGLVPLRRWRGPVPLATARPELLRTHAQRLRAAVGTMRPMVATQEQVAALVAEAAGPELARRAETRTSTDESCRSLVGWAFRAKLLVLTLATLALVVAAPQTSFSVALGLAILTLVANTALLAGIVARAPEHGPQIPRQPARNVVPMRLPRVSLLIPLHRERAIAGTLVARLSRLTYPRALIEAWLVVEEDDATTRAALAEADLPPWMTPVTVPRGALKTKPRAMNYALDLCRGEIVGVYDAEDMPAPDQLDKVVAGFRAAPPEVACLQGRLGFYNPRANWLSRCFAVEYSVWFGVVLPGLARMGLVLPLGGTTLFFRRDALEALGAWDAHNVTEDAELGLRLARHGYRTELVDTDTLEEANCRVWTWIRQRSRWLKGYAMTWAVHMRNPLRLLRQLGAWRFLGVQMLFLGTLAGFLGAPLLWTLVLLALGLPHPWQGLGPLPSLLISLTVGLSGVMTLTSQVLALRMGGQSWLIPWLPTLPFYFMLATAAAWRGLIQCITRPFFWDKTAHGVSPPDATPPPRARHPA